MDDVEKLLAQGDVEGAMKALDQLGELDAADARLARAHRRPAGREERARS